MTSTPKSVQKDKRRGRSDETSEEEDSGIQDKEVEPVRNQVKEQKKTRNTPTSNDKENDAPLRKTRRAISENTPGSSAGLYTQHNANKSAEKRQQVPEEEPPIVPVVLRRKDENKEIGSAVERKVPLTKDDIQKMNLKKKTT